jgi:hypothetical protein
VYSAFLYDEGEYGTMFEICCFFFGVRIDVYDGDEDGNGDGIGV